LPPAIRIEPHWLDARDALAIHDRQIAEHGGISGVRDSNLLDSALGRPVNQWNYGTDDPAALAAAYAYGVARNHPFADGNKRTAWVLARLFLALNGQRLQATQLDATLTMLAVAAGEISEKVLSQWIRDHMVSR
jgi:death-on-curing protein